MKYLIGFILILSSQVSFACNGIDDFVVQIGVINDRVTDLYEMSAITDPHIEHINNQIEEIAAVVDSAYVSNDKDLMYAAEQYACAYHNAILSGLDLLEAQYKFEYLRES